MKKLKIIFSIAIACLLLTNVFPSIVHAAGLKITKQPKISYTAYGKTAKATIKAKGKGLKYNWYIKKADKKKYKKTSVNKPTYSVKMTDKTKNSKVYCVVKGKKGKSIKSKTVTLRMKVSIITQPQNVSVKNGDIAKVALKAKGDGLKYVWYTKKIGANTYSKTTVTKATYSIKIDKNISGSSVYCIVKDKYGNSVKSKIVTLEMKTEEPLTITKQPDDTSASFKFEQVGFGIIVTGGTAPYNYQLQYNSDNINKWTDMREDVEVLTMGSMTELVFMVSFTDDYRYRIVVTDAAGNQVISKVVYVERLTEPLAIVNQPQSTIANIGDQVGFGISVTGGTEPYTYKLLYRESEFSEWCLMDGVEILRLGAMTELVFELNFSQNYEYCIFVTDATRNHVESDVVWVEQEEVDTPLTIDWQINDIGVNLGDTIELAVGVSGGSAPYTYQWQYIKTGLENWQDIEDSDADTLVITVQNGHLDDDFKYRCIIIDAQNEEIISQPIDLVELLEPFIISSQPQNVIAQAGDMVMFSVTVEGGKEPYTYQWEYMSDEFSWDIVGETWALGAKTDTVTFAIDENEFVYNYKYRCKIVDVNNNVLYTDVVWVVEQ